MVAESSSSASRSRGGVNNNNNNGTMTNSRQQQQSVSVLPMAIQSPLFSRSTAQSFNTILASFNSQLEALTKGQEYAIEAAMDIEEFHGESATTKATTISAPNNYSHHAQVGDLELTLIGYLNQSRQLSVEKEVLIQIQSRIQQGDTSIQNLEAVYTDLVKQEIASLVRTDKMVQYIIPGQNGGKPQKSKLSLEAIKQMNEFRDRVWSVHHREAFPVQYQVSPAAAQKKAGQNTGGGGDDDDDLQVIEAQEVQQADLKCPITTQYFEDPVTSIGCRHSYSKQAILDLLKQNPNLCQCPVHGCPKAVTRADLRTNKRLQRNVEAARLLEQENIRVDYSVVE